MNIKALERKISGLEKIIAIGDEKITRLKEENQNRKKEAEALTKLKDEYYELEERMNDKLFPVVKKEKHSNSGIAGEQPTLFD